MKKLTEFLARFRNLKPPREAIEDEARKIIKEKINLGDDSFCVVFKKPNLTISSQNPALKSEVFLFRESLLSRLKDKFGPKTEIKIFFK